MSAQAKFEAFSRFEARPLTPALGAELIGADLAYPDAQLFDEVHAALLQYKVVFFRDQVLDRGQHITFARGFGELEIHPATPSDQPDPEILRIAHGPNSRGSENNWHSDVTWRERPSLGSVLRAIELPDNGGDTLFANMAMAYDRLSDAMKEMIDGLVAVHDIARVFAKRLGKAPEELHEKYPPTEHPVVRTHPETKERLIYVNDGFTSHIKDMDAQESDAL